MTMFILQETPTADGRNEPVREFVAFLVVEAPGDVQIAGWNAEFGVHSNNEKLMTALKSVLKDLFGGYNR